jgi:hypothetical protein
MELESFDDESPAEIHHRILLFGESGTGKTAALVRAKADASLSFNDVITGKAKPVGSSEILLLATESNGLPTARLFNPKVRFVRVETAEKLAEVMVWLRDGGAVEAGIRLVAIDGLTEVQRLIKDQIKKANEKDKSRAGRESDRFDQDDWGYLNERVRKWLRLVRSLPVHIVCSALELGIVNEETGRVHVCPSMEGKKLPKEVGSYFSAVGRQRKVASSSGEVAFQTDFTLPDRYKVKSCGALAGTLVPCAEAWLDVLDGTAPSAFRLRESEVSSESTEQTDTAEISVKTRGLKR